MLLHKGIHQLKDAVGVTVKKKKLSCNCPLHMMGFVIPSNPITLSRYDTFKKELMKQELVLGTRWQCQVRLCCS